MRPDRFADARVLRIADDAHDLDRCRRAWIVAEADATTDGRLAVEVLLHERLVRDRHAERVILAERVIPVARRRHSLVPIVEGTAAREVHAHGVEVAGADHVVQREAALPGIRRTALDRHGHVPRSAFEHTLGGDAGRDYAGRRLQPSHHALHELLGAHPVVSVLARVDGE